MLADILCVFGLLAMAQMIIYSAARGLSAEMWESAEFWADVLTGEAVDEWPEFLGICEPLATQQL